MDPTLTVASPAPLSKLPGSPAVQLAQARERHRRLWNKRTRRVQQKNMNVLKKTNEVMGWASGSNIAKTKHPHSPQKKKKIVPACPEATCVVQMLDRVVVRKRRRRTKTTSRHANAPTACRQRVCSFEQGANNQEKEGLSTLRLASSKNQPTALLRDESPVQQHRSILSAVFRCSKTPGDGRQRRDPRRTVSIAGRPIKAARSNSFMPWTSRAASKQLPESAGFQSSVLDTATEDN